MDKQFAQMGTVTVTSGGTAETVSIGFNPKYVRVWNVNNLTSYEWFYGMDAGTSLDNANHDTTQNSANAAGGITVSSGVLTLGVDICDTTDDVVRWVAFRC